MTRMRKPIGPPELLLMLGAAVLMFGGRKIPEVVKALGDGIRNFKDWWGGGPGGPAAA